MLAGAGESPALLPVQTVGLLHQRLLAEATTLAYQDYFLLSAVLGGLAILPALPWEEGWKGVRRLWGDGRPSDPRQERLSLGRKRRCRPMTRSMATGQVGRSQRGPGRGQKGADDWGVRRSLARPSRPSENECVTSGKLIL
jgi:hypothetical protein